MSLSAAERCIPGYARAEPRTEPPAQRGQTSAQPLVFHLGGVGQAHALPLLSAWQAAIDLEAPSRLQNIVVAFSGCSGIRGTVLYDRDVIRLADV